MSARENAHKILQLMTFDYPKGKFIRLQKNYFSDRIPC